MAQLSLFLSTFLLSSFLAALTIDGQTAVSLLPKCWWQLTLKTGNLDLADTRSKIDMVIHIAMIEDYRIQNLSKYGVESSGNSYFQKGQQDTFRFQAPCDFSVCNNATFISDGTGYQPGWYLASAALKITDLSVLPVPLLDSVPFPGTQKNATVERWLSVVDDPYSLNVTVNFC